MKTPGLVFPDTGFEILKTSKVLNPRDEEDPLPQGGNEELRSPWPISRPDQREFIRRILPLEI